MPTIEQCKANPALLDQKTGCCGFAGVLMALLERKSDTFDELMKCVIMGTKFKGIDKAERVGDRLLRRLDAGIIPDETREDFAMCLALMILFKEHSKQTGSDAWERCIAYSRNWAWAYSNIITTGPAPQALGKIKDLPSDAMLDKEFSMAGLSYKRGDMACPDDVMPALLGLVDLTVQVQGELVDDAGFSAMLGKPAGVAKTKIQTFAALMNRIQSTGSVRDEKFNGVILGVGNRKGFEKYHNISHWVYVPTKPNALPASGDFKVWTWGAEHDFFGGIIPNKAYYPAYAIYLAK